MNEYPNSKERGWSYIWSTDGTRSYLGLWILFRDLVSSYKSFINHLVTYWCIYVRVSYKPFNNLLIYLRFHIGSNRTERVLYIKLVNEKNQNLEEILSWKAKRTYLYTHIHTHISIYMYILHTYLCIHTYIWYKIYNTHILWYTHIYIIHNTHI